MRRSSPIILLTAIVFMAMSLYAAVPAKNEGTVQKTSKVVEKKADEKKVEEKKIDLGDFIYASEGRRDPFQPVLLLKAKASREMKPAKSRKTGSTTEPLGYELEELRLVGVLKSDKGMMAMMEDTQGKGIFFRKGDYLNQNMWVADISAKDVIVAYKLKGEIKKIVVDIPTKKEKGGL